MRLRIEFRPINPDTLEIHSSEAAAALPQRTIPRADLAATALPDNPSPAALEDLGRRLYRLLDGPERRLAALTPNSTLELHSSGAAAAIAWELLHDGESFLVQRGILPVRIIIASPSDFSAAATPPPAAANRPLQVLFMACSPRNVQPVLSFETEERIFLDATQDQPLYLTPEESGSVEELEETVKSYDPFDIFHLTGHGDIYREEDHEGYPPKDQAPLPEGKPILFTEDPVAGFCLLATAEHLVTAFGDRLPRLVFLSACRTGEQQQQQQQQSTAPASLTLELIAQGFPAVLGWASSVYEDSATLAAALLYKELASGATIEQALRHTFRELTKPKLKPDADASEPFQIPDWHLLRLFVAQSAASAALVTPKATRGRQKFEPPRPDEGFLDKQGEGKVAGSKRFVGRRRPLQRTLPALEAESGRTGVIIWGIGGLGKSSLANRLCDRVERRRPYFRRVVLVGPLDDIRLLSLLRSKYQDHDALAELNDNAARPLGGRLQRFLRAINHDAPLLLVLDDFEQNIDLDTNAAGGFLLHPAAFNTLAALDRAIYEAGAESRLIVTSRYFHAGAYPPELRLLAEQLPQMDRDELRKKLFRELDLDTPKQQEDLIRAAAGSPKLFEFVAKHGEEQGAHQFREWLKLQSLLESLAPAERQQLARLSVFQLPVPESLARQVAMTTAEGAFALLPGALGLGLVERNEPPAPCAERHWEVPLLVRPLLESEFTGDEWRQSFSTAARSAYKLWWEDADGTAEPHVIEIVRLATLGGEQTIACDLTRRLANYWNNAAHYRFTVAKVPPVLDRFADPHLLYSLAVAEHNLGEKDALVHLERAEFLLGQSPRERALILHQKARSIERQGDLDQSLQLCRESCAGLDRLGDEKSKANVMYQIARLLSRLGDVDGAREIQRQAVEIEERLGTVHGDTTLQYQKAVLLDLSKDVSGALEQYSEAAKSYKRENDKQGEASALRRIADLSAGRGDVDGAMQAYQDASGICELLGDSEGKAAILSEMACLVSQKTQDHAKAMDCFLEAARTLARIGAWLELSFVLCNLATVDPTRNLHWLAQATWLTVALRQPVPNSLGIVAALINALPANDKLDLPLAALGMRIFGNHVKAERKATQFDQATELLVFAAHNHKMTAKAAIDWVKQQAQDPARLIRETLAALEALAPEPWAYSRQAVIDSIIRNRQTSASAATAASSSAPPTT